MIQEIWKDVVGYEGLYQVSKLSEFQIKRIRLMKEIQPNMREIDIAGLFKVSRSLIGQIVRKEIWQHIT